MSLLNTACGNCSHSPATPANLSLHPKLTPGCMQCKITRSMQLSTCMSVHTNSWNTKFSREHRSPVHSTCPIVKQTSLSCAQLGASEEQVKILGLGILCWASGQHRGLSHSTAVDQQLWLGVCLLGVRDSGADVDAGVGPPCA